MDLAWLAGVFESEGSVRINVPTKRNRGSLLADMVNTDEELVLPFHERYGGYYRLLDLGGNRRPFWRWRIAARQAAAFFEEILPHVQSNRVRTKIALGLEFQRQKQHSRRDAEYLAAQEAFYLEMKALNIRGR